ncbi:DUF6445 family protein [Hyphomonas johnsonii]|uniref:Phytanoyl-CoA dioxygenase n=1 Tax=Hyphomonas johnsonii MHS-2 TaxID=1280950 RepID=A0A059FVG1_9PROT|nr:DUF6445 family protein [Hyphomonas johnsonii]KCZ94690.1 hypothetical protein HJO_04920 [Hyphomonas johnsonii MHS-2]
MLPSIAIFDDFLREPMRARTDALRLGYDPKRNHGNYAGLMSDKPLAIQGLVESVSSRVGAPLEAAAGTAHAHCRLTCKGDKGRSGVHVDPCYYSGILFLNAPWHSKGGTDFYTHRRTGLDGVPKNPIDLLAAGYNHPDALIEDVVNKDTLRPEKWHRTLRIPMKFNRLVLFSPWLFHNAGPAFGNSPEDGRLVCLMFFNRKAGEVSAS